MALQPPNTLPPVQPNPRPPFRALGATSYMPTTMLPGFYVGSDSDISARDVPADGSISFFPCKDLSHIVIKQWNGNTLESAIYVPLQQAQQTQTSLPAPPPPSSQQQPQNEQITKQEVEQKQDQTAEALLAGFKSMNEGIANAFGQFGATLNAMQQNLDKLNSRFMDEGGMG